MLRNYNSKIVAPYLIVTEVHREANKNTNYIYLFIIDFKEVEKNHEKRRKWLLILDSKY